MLPCASACRKTETRFDILSFKNPPGTECFSEQFDPGSFAVNAHNNWDIVFEIPATPLAVELPDDPTTTTSAPATEAPGHRNGDGIWMSQLIHINMFWRPVPGTTYAESSQTNATILYCLITGPSVIAYEGAGFVYFSRSRDGKTIVGRIESSDLVPTTYVNEPVDLFGPCRLQGAFKAHQDRKHVVSVLQQLRTRLPPPRESTPLSSGGTVANG
ncbi:MAG: hypothetical protein JXQ75_13675 [Phycisphaerae bacterium]|nr:hypothetical protein [Phycisphaerae bacterium]